MHYVFFISLALIFAIALPLHFLALFVAAIVLAALVVKLAAKLITSTEPPLGDCVKATIYSFLLAIIAFLFGVKLTVAVPLFGIIATPLLIIFAEAVAYSATLSITLLTGHAVALCVTLIWWLLGYAFGGFTPQALKYFL